MQAVHARGVHSIPTFMVDGRFVVSGAQVGRRQAATVSCVTQVVSGAQVRGGGAGRLRHSPPPTNCAVMESAVSRVK